MDTPCSQSDPEMWFPENGAASGVPIGICNNCPVQAQCLEYALKHDIRYGIWGGTTARDRQLMKRRALSRRNKRNGFS